MRKDSSMLPAVFLRMPCTGRLETARMHCPNLGDLTSSGASYMKQTVEGEMKAFGRGIKVV